MQRPHTTPHNIAREKLKSQGLKKRANNKNTDFFQHSPMKASQSEFDFLNHQKPQTQQNCRKSYITQNQIQLPRTSQNQRRQGTAKVTLKLQTPQQQKLGFNNNSQDGENYYYFQQNYQQNNQKFGQFMVNRSQSSQIIKNKFLSKPQTLYLLQDGISQQDTTAQSFSSLFFSQKNLQKNNILKGKKHSSHQFQDNNILNEKPNLDQLISPNLNNNNLMQQQQQQQQENDYLTDRVDVNSQEEFQMVNINSQDRYFPAPQPKLPEETLKKMKRREEKLKEQKRIKAFLDSIPDKRFSYNNSDVHGHIRKKNHLEQKQKFNTQQQKEVYRHVKLCNVKDHIEPNNKILGEPLQQDYNQSQKLVPKNNKELKEQYKQEQEVRRQNFVDGNLVDKQQQQEFQPIISSKEQREQIQRNLENANRNFLQVFEDNLQKTSNMKEFSPQQQQSIFSNNLNMNINLRQIEQLIEEQEQEETKRRKKENDEYPIEIKLDESWQEKRDEQVIVLEKTITLLTKKLNNLYDLQKQQSKGELEKQNSKLVQSNKQKSKYNAYAIKQLLRKSQQMLKKLEDQQDQNEELNESVHKFLDSSLYQAFEEQITGKPISSHRFKQRKRRRSLCYQANLEGQKKPQASLSLDPSELSRLLDYVDKLNMEFQALIQDHKEIFMRGKFNPWLKSNEQVLSEQEMQYIRKLYQLKEKDPYSASINWQEIDGVVNKLKFFTRYAMSTRIALLQVAEFVTFDANTTIFNQGDYGDHMYIILKGSVNVRINVKIGDYTEQKLVAVLYDGFHFGELSMMHTHSKRVDPQSGLQAVNAESLSYIREQLKKYDQIAKQEEYARLKGQAKDDIEEQKKILHRKLFEPKEDDIDTTTMSSKQKGFTNKRAATIVASDNCEMLRISKDLFSTVLMNLMQDELDAKIKLLATLNLFDHFQPFALIPIANILKTEKYAINDVLIRQGQEIDRFFIVVKGRLKIVRIEEIVRSEQLSDFAVSFKQKPKPFHCGKNVEQEFKFSKQSNNDDLKQQLSENIKEKNKEKEQQIYIDNFEAEHPLRKQEYENTIQIFDYEKKYHQVPGEFKYNKFTEYGKFTVGDYFGCRSITGKKLTSSGSIEAQLTVIADTNDVQIYSLKKDQLQYLPLTIKNYFLAELEIIKEFDNFNMGVEGTKIKYWDQVKEDLYRKHLRYQAEEKNVPKYKEY